MARSVVTIDVDTSGIRLLEVRGRRVERWASAELEPDLMADGTIQDPAALGEQVRRLMAASGLKGRSILASLSGLYSVARLIAVPAGPGGDTRTAMANLVREAVPGDDISPQFQIISADSLGRLLLVLGSPAAVVDSQIGMLQYAGLYPRAIELKGMALARAVDASNAIIANVERASLDVVLVTQGVPKIMRTVSIPEDMSEEARGGHTAGVLQRTVAYYKNHNADQPIPPETPLFLVGPCGATIRPSGSGYSPMWTLRCMTSHPPWSTQSTCLCTSTPLT